MMKYKESLYISYVEVLYDRQQIFGKFIYAKIHGNFSMRNTVLHL